MVYAHRDGSIKVNFYGILTLESKTNGVDS